MDIYTIYLFSVSLSFTTAYEIYSLRVFLCPSPGGDRGTTG